MRQLAAFFEKEWMETYRTGKFLILCLITVLFGIMNPAIAKLTPWLLGTMADSMENTGIVIEAVEVDALSSWAQFYKNIPMFLIIFILMYGGILAGEYAKGTLINMVTKGMKRWKILLAKFGIVLLYWTAGYWCCYGITYGYNAYFWDNSIAKQLAFPAFCFYLLGVWLMTLLVTASAVCGSSSGVLLFTGGGFVVVYFLGMLPKVTRFLPAQLAKAGELVMISGKMEDYWTAIAVTAVLSVADVAAAVLLFNRRYL